MNRAISTLPRQLLVITGPTAVGKTNVAVELAQRLETVILSADSRQCYRELNIGVARPSPEELNAVPHYFIASESIQENWSAARYENYALALIDKLFEEHPIIVVVGGTGLYIKALLQGLDSIPSIDPSLRAQLITSYTQNGLPWLQAQIQEWDPAFGQTDGLQNPQRMLRALEVIQATGKSIRTYQTGKSLERNFSTLQIGLEMPRDQLYDRINSRVLSMMDQGLEAEARSLFAFRHLNALQTVGYKELFEYFDGQLSLEAAIERIQIHSRRYAKRQLTWFKAQPNVHWFDVSAQPPIWPLVQELLPSR